MSKLIPLSYSIETSEHKGVSDVLIIDAGNNTEYVAMSFVIAMSRRKSADDSVMLTITIPGSCICLGPFGKESEPVITNIIDHWLKHR